jgi:hypothetical protein
LREIVGKKLQHELLLFVPRSLPPQPMHKFHLPQRKVEQTAIRRIPFVIVHVLIPSNEFQMGFLWGDEVKSVNAVSSPSPTIVSVEQSQTNTPNALASHHLIFPPVAATEADKRRS